MFSRWSRNIRKLRKDCVVPGFSGHLSDPRCLTHNDASRRPQARGLVNQPFPAQVDEEALETEGICPDDRRHDVRDNKTSNKFLSKAEI